MDVDDFYQLTESCGVNLLETIGHGAVGIVHLGRQEIAIKRTCYRDIYGNIDEEVKTLATQEIETYKKLMNHPNIVQFYNYRDDGKSIWIMLEYCGLGTLSSYIKTRVLSFKQKIKLMKESASALAHIHSLGMTHNDIKPSNVLMKKEDKEDILKMSDFSGSQMIGTSEYMAPELHKLDGKHGLAEIDRKKTDIFSLGLLFSVIWTSNTDTKTAANRVPPYGEKLLEASRDKNTLPVLFPEESYATLDGPSKQLQYMMEQMTSFYPIKRLQLSDVVFQLVAIEKKDIDYITPHALQMTLKMNVFEISENVLPDILLPRLFSRGVINNKDLEYIRPIIEFGSKTYHCEMLMECILRKGYTGQLLFLEMLEETNPDLYLKIKSDMQFEFGKYSYTDGDHGIRSEIASFYTSIRDNYEEILQQIDVNIIASNLYVTGRLSQKKMEEIRNESSNTEKPKLLLDFILQSPDEDIWEFVEILRKIQYPLFIWLDRSRKANHLACSHSFSGIKDYLYQAYTDNKFCTLHTLAGENVTVDVSDDKAILPFEFEANVKTGTLPTKYTQTKFNSFEEIIDKLQESADHRLVTCTSQPGCGKTVLVHRLVCKWMDHSNKMLKNYEAVFAISMKDINTELPFLDILCQGKNTIVHSDMKHALEGLLLSKVTSQNVLLVLDGVDEANFTEESDVNQVITGKLYPYVKVMITTRPGAETLQGLTPLYKVNITGINIEEINAYIMYRFENRYSLSENLQVPSPSQRSVECLITHLKENMMDIYLLQVPLYLELVLSVLYNHWTQHLSFTDLLVPNTSTYLFNQFLKYLIRVWLQRIGRPEKDIHFERSVFDGQSNIPVDIKLKLHAFGKMSYDFLRVKQNVFTETDLRDYLIDIEDISKSGLFSLYHQDRQLQISCHHKQIQEFLAAIYLSHTKFSDSAFSTLISETTTSTGEPVSLPDIFENIQGIMLFTFGFAPAFAIDILNKLKHRVCVTKFSHCIDISLESKLCFESSDKRVYEAMLDLLLNSGIKVSARNFHNGSISTMYRLCKDLEKSHCQILLQKWYDLDIQEEETTCIMRNSENADTDSEGENLIKVCGKGMMIRNLNDTLYFLLSHFELTQVKTLTLNTSDVTDVRKIIKVFPMLSKLFVQDGSSTLDDFLNSFCSTPQPQETSLLSDCILKGNDMPMPTCSVSSLMHQSNLVSLKLKWIDILPNIQDVRQISWPKLTNLEICLWKLDHENVEMICSNFMHLLTRMPKLQSLSFGCNFSKVGLLDKAHKNVIDDFLLHISENTEHMSTLRFYGIIEKTKIQDLARYLDKLGTLNTLGIRWRDIQKMENRFIQQMGKLKGISKVQIMCSSADKQEAESVIKELQTIKNDLQCSFQVNVWIWDLLQ